MSPEELIEKKKKSESVAYHKFVLISNKYGDSVLYCFFEGKDDSKYYISRIRRHFNESQPIVCNNKKNVISVFQRIHKDAHYSQYYLAFFIDRDFDEPNNISEIYETPCYSIENLYCSEEFFSRVLKNELHVGVYDPYYDIAVKFFKDCQREFHDSILLFNAWYYCLRDQCRKNKMNTNVYLNNKMPGDFIEFNFDSGINAKYNICSIKALFPDSLDVSELHIDQVHDKLSSCDLSMVLRGKYELEFIKMLLRFLIEDANDKNKQNIIPHRTSFNFQDDLFISQLAQYADTPECLEEYLRSVSEGKYIRETA